MMAAVDLALTVTELPDSSGLRAEFSYATELFDEATVAALSRQFVTILRAAVTAPAEPTLSRAGDPRGTSSPRSRAGAPCGAIAWTTSASARTSRTACE